MDEWVKDIDAQEASLVFAGAYGGNPASILGHTFLRFYGSQDKEYGQNLLSYSVGFLATPDPNDNPAIYALKGLTGAYPGFYNIEAHYIKVGLYNNSESRDLWEWPLNLNQDEVSLLIHHIWELNFNARLSYYFIGKNCSHRIIKALNVIRPQTQLSDNLGWIVIPSETVRLTDEEGLISGKALYRPSIKRKIDIRLAHMNTEELKQYKIALNQVETIGTIQSPLILDTLVDHWTHMNLSKNNRMSDSENQLMEASLQQRAQLKKPSSHLFKDEEIKDHYQLNPILDGHSSNVLSILGNPTPHHETLSFAYRAGLHPDWMNTLGYDSINQMEYLGFSYSQNEKPSLTQEPLDEWEFLLVRVKALSPINSVHKEWSWGFDTALQNACLLCESYSNQGQLKISALGGVSLVSGNEYLYLLPQVKILLWQQDGFKSALPLGFLVGGIFETGRYKFLGEYEKSWWKKKTQDHLNLNLSYLLSKNLSLRWNLNLDWLNQTQGNQRHLFGVSYFF